MKQATRQKYRKSMQYIKQLDEKIKTESEMLNILKNEFIQSVVCFMEYALSYILIRLSIVILL